MADLVPRRSALLGTSREGVFATAAGDEPGVVLRERRPCAIVEIAAFRGTAAAVRGAVAGILGVAPPEVRNTALRGDDAAILWAGPDRWLVVAAEEAHAGLADRLRAAIGGDGAAIELDSGRTVIRVSGPRARDLLAKGIGVDLHPAAFPEGACAHTVCGHFAVVLRAVETGGIEVLVARGFAASFWEWLAEHAQEWGYRVDPAGPEAA